MTPTTAQQATQIINQLNALCLRKEVLNSELEVVSEQIKATRNLAAGIELGQKVAAEAAAAAPKAADVPQKPAARAPLQDAPQVTQ